MSDVPPTKNCDGISEPKMPVLIPNPRGNGALLSGGVPGNKGGGNTKKRIRGRLNDIIDRIGIDAVEQVIENGNASERMKAFDVAAKYGLGEAQQVMKEEMMEAAVSAINEFFTDSETRNAFIARFCELLEQFA